MEIIKHLNNTFEPFLKYCTDKEKGLIESHKSEFFFKKNQELYREKTTPLGMYVLSHGVVKLVKKIDHSHILLSLKSGHDIFSYSCLICDSSHIDTAVALSDTEISIIPTYVFQKIVSENKDVKSFFIETLCKDIEMLNSKLSLISSGHGKQRIAYALLYLRDFYEMNNGNGESTFRINRNDMAQFVGLTREAVIRLLSTMQEEELIEISRKDIKITDERRLKQLYN